MSQAVIVPNGVRHPIQWTKRRLARNQRRVRGGRGNYYFVDAARQRRDLEVRIGVINATASKELGFDIVKIDVERAVLLMYRRVAKFYGLRNKYPAAKQEHNR